mmetsp:Transcript_12849/g.20200  ORF Transcript_12849/g.20200 Transcript_12849/m.20200 type:complete len:108 (+) Transcript_12849:433-756(+)
MPDKESLIESSNIDDKLKGMRRSTMYCSGINPGGPTAAVYKLASCRSAFTPSAAVRRVSINCSFNVFQADLHFHDCRFLGPISAWSSSPNKATLVAPIPSEKVNQTR